MRRGVPAVALAAVIALAIAVPQLDTSPDNGPTGNQIAQLVAAADNYFEAAAATPDPVAQKAALAQASKLVAQAQQQAAKLPDDGRERLLASLQTKIDLLQERVDQLETQLAVATTTTTTTSPETTTTTSTTSTTRPPSATTTTTTSTPSATTSTTSPPSTTTTTRPATTTTTEPSVDVAAKHERRP